MLCIFESICVGVLHGAYAKSLYCDSGFDVGTVDAQEGVRFYSVQLLLIFSLAELGETVKTAPNSEPPPPPGMSELTCARNESSCKNPKPA